MGLLQDGAGQLEESQVPNGTFILVRLVLENPQVPRTRRKVWNEDVLEKLCWLWSEQEVQEGCVREHE